MSEDTRPYIKPNRRKNVGRSILKGAHSLIGTIGSPDPCIKIRPEVLYKQAKVALNSFRSHGIKCMVMCCTTNGVWGCATGVRSY